jgi:hypothetical protein
MSNDSVIREQRILKYVFGTKYELLTWQLFLAQTVTYYRPKYLDLIKTRNSGTLLLP